MSIAVILKRTTFLLFGPLLIGLVSLWFYLHGGRFISTDNAYLKAEIITVSSELTGKVLEVYVIDNQRVEKGDVLLKLFDEPQLIALARAKANMATVVSELQGQKAEYASKEMDIVHAQTEIDFRTRELERIRQLRRDNSISAAQYDQAEFATNTAVNELESKQQELKVLAAKLINPNDPVAKHPRYLQAESELNKARLEYSYGQIKAPVSGIATNVAAHAGENIIAGTSLLSIIRDDKNWIEANFKETDLTYVRSGQPVTVSIDTFPDVKWTARVESITPATGSEFSLLPAQNSSGNWVKVVQRVMVKIAFDSQDRTIPLSTGMSAEVSIDTNHVRSIPWLNDSLNRFIREF